MRGAGSCLGLPVARAKTCIRWARPSYVMHARRSSSSLGLLFQSSPGRSLGSHVDRTISCRRRRMQKDRALAYELRIVGIDEGSLLRLVSGEQTWINQ